MYVPSSQDELDLVVSQVEAKAASLGGTFDVWLGEKTCQVPSNRAVYGPQIK